MRPVADAPTPYMYPMRCWLVSGEWFERLYALAIDAPIEDRETRLGPLGQKGQPGDVSPDCARFATKPRRPKSDETDIRHPKSSGRRAIRVQSSGRGAGRWANPSYLVLGLGLLPYARVAETYDGSVHLSCALIEVMDGAPGVDCQRGPHHRERGF
jgi:hypothetical protein